MATNVKELEQELLQLENRKKAQLEVLKRDVELLSDTMKPTAIVKRSFTNWVNKRSGNTGNGGSSIGSNLLGIAGTFVLEEMILKDAGIVKKILGRILSSNIMTDLLKGDDSLVKKGILKVADWVKDKTGPSLPNDNQPPA